MIDLVKEFATYEKKIVQNVRESIKVYSDSECKKRLQENYNRLAACWDMKINNADGARSSRRGRNEQQFMAQVTYPLVKNQQLIRRAIFNNNFSSEPFFTVKATGATPDENAKNIQDLIQSNNDQTRFRASVVKPCHTFVAKYGVSIVYTEYAENDKKAWRTVGDPLMGSRRVFGVVKNTKNAVNTVIHPLNYGQNPQVTNNNDSTFRFHYERWPMYNFMNRLNNMKPLYIAENLQKAIEDIKRGAFHEKDYFDPQGRQLGADYDKLIVNDVIRGQFVLNGIDGNEDSDLTYYLEMVGDTIIRFQDNPYDMDLNQYTVLCVEPREEFWWGNTPAQYSMGSEKAINALTGIMLENAIQSLRRYLFYNKNAADPELINNMPSNGMVPIDVGKDVNMQSMFYTYQVPENAGNTANNMYARLMENDQRLNSSPDLSRPDSMGGFNNKTATAASIMTNKGDMLDADIIEEYSNRWGEVGDKEITVLMQYLGNLGPILIKPRVDEALRMVKKENILGNYHVLVDTSAQQNNSTEMQKYQNIVTWLLNLSGSYPAAQKYNLEPLIKEVLRMGKFLNVDQIVSSGETGEGQPGYVESQQIPGQEVAGAGQELTPEQMAMSGALPQMVGA